MQIVDENDEILEPALRPMCVQRLYIYGNASIFDASIFDTDTNRQTDGQQFSGLPFEAAGFIISCAKPLQIIFP